MADNGCIYKVIYSAIKDGQTEYLALDADRNSRWFSENGEPVLCSFPTKTCLVSEYIPPEIKWFRIHKAYSWLGMHVGTALYQTLRDAKSSTNNTLGYAKMRFDGDGRPCVLTYVPHAEVDKYINNDGDQ